ncbi:carbohydrate ABC transporter permease [Streptomyces winkii]|uniref:carbohydrate ABC transporter permease n=1 Tax=Streptomyces winkii TaxID=3051178 RepID=UPI0028D5EF60|nr:sugar ABC transporter permease [Streptomyces sp. DSM 40971]
MRAEGSTRPAPAVPGARAPRRSVPYRRTGASRPSGPRRTQRGRQTRAAWLFLAPSLAALAVFVVWPMIQAAYLSFTDYNLMQAAHWIGLGNYRQLLDDPEAWNALENTLVYAVVSTPVSVVLALALALFLNRSMALRGFLRSAVFLPFVVSLGVVSIAWAFLLDPNIGLLSDWLSGVGLSTEQGWLEDPALAMPAVIAVGVWKNLGFYMVMYLAGLQGIPPELHDAARVDGASSWQRLRRVTWPLLTNQTMLITIMAAIGTLQAFDQIYVMTHGGPFFQTETLVVFTYRVGFERNEFGYAAAVSWVLLVLVFVLSMLQFGYFRRRAVTM